MPKPEMVTMSMRELDRFKVIQAVVEHGLMVWRAAEKLGLSRRQVERLVIRYREDGPSGLGSRKRGHESNRQLPPGLESRVRGLIRDTYADFGPTLICLASNARHSHTVCCHPTMPSPFQPPGKSGPVRRQSPA
jgi:hypothetical protein